MAALIGATAVRCGMRMRIIALINLLGFVAWSFRPADATSYISALVYQKFNCPQLAQEAGSIASRAAQLSGAPFDQRIAPSAAPGGSIVIQWPEISSVEAASSSKLASLKDQMLAIEQAIIEKQCNIQLRQNVSKQR